LIVLSLASAPAVATLLAVERSGSQVQSADVKIYEAFRAWATRQPKQDLEALLRNYRDVLAKDGLDAAEIDRRIQVIAEQGRRLEIERWNRILTAPKPNFNTKPNAFLVQMTQGRPPGTALDVGMGQGRNALYLAQQGWTVTGFDPADQAVAAAEAAAKRLGVALTTATVTDEQFDFGRDKWDLIVLSYVGVRHLVGRVYDSLRPGGMVVIEGFHRDATKNASIGGGVVFDTNELPQLFDRFRLLQYEDVEAPGDFGLAAGSTRVVRLAAQKP
jgi:SAM-dependent methyltransferase